MEKGRTLFDISQEVFSCNVYPGDPAPEMIPRTRISDGAVCNLTAFSMCAHNGTHVDAPFHFLQDGKTIDRIPLDHFTGDCFLVRHEGDVSGDDAKEILRRAEAAFRACGVEPVIKPIRGGTDGARLSYMGLPCPNLSTGGYQFHGVFEFIPVRALQVMPEMLRDLVYSFTEE